MGGDCPTRSTEGIARFAPRRGRQVIAWPALSLALPCRLLWPRRKAWLPYRTSRRLRWTSLRPSRCSASIRFQAWCWTSVVTVGRDSFLCLLALQICGRVRASLLPCIPLRLAPPDVATRPEDQVSQETDSEGAGDHCNLDGLEIPALHRQVVPVRQLCAFPFRECPMMEVSHDLALFPPCQLMCKLAPAYRCPPASGFRRRVRQGRLAATHPARPETGNPGPE